MFRGKSYAVVHQGPFLPFINPLKDGFSLNFTTSEDEGVILWRGNVSNFNLSYIMGSNQ